MDIAISKNKVPVRLTNERWMHITIGHPEIADYYYEIFETIEQPEIIYEGSNNELIATKGIAKNKYLLVIYKESNKKDGFVITAFLSNKKQYFKNKKILWQQ